MKANTIKLLVVSMMLLTSCAAVKVETLYDQETSFDDYKTFCWFTGCEFKIDGPDYIKKDSATVALFQNAIVNELTKKGFIQDEDNPDFLIYMLIVVEEREGQLWSATESFDTFGDGAFPPGIFMDQTYHYLKGSMIIDIADAATSRMVWRSDAVRYMDINPDLDEKEIQRGVAKALKKFPPEK